MQLKKYFFLLLFSLSLHALSAQIIDSSKLVLSDKVLFDFGKYELTLTADSTISDVIEKITALKNYEINITAHTDAIGTNQNNLVLSENRANAVKQLMVEKGIAENLIHADVFGEDQPESDNDTDFGRQLNRRATIEVIQKIKYTPYKGQIKDEKTGLAIPASVVIRTKEQRDSLVTDSLGNFETILPLGAVAGIDVYAKDYFFETKMFKVTPNAKNKLTIPLKKAAVGEKIDIKNLFFVGNEAILLKRSLPELPKLLKFMELNDSIKVEIAGHINRPNYPPVDELSWDYKLSVRRAKMVYEFLLKNDIPEERISYKGYGNFQMRFPRAKSEKEQAQNRRVEIRIVEGT